MYIASVVATFARRSASSLGVLCQSEGNCTFHPLGSRPPVGPSREISARRTTRSSRERSIFSRSAAIVSYHARMSLSPVAFSPAGTSP